MSKLDNCWYLIFQKHHNNFLKKVFMIYPAKNSWIYIAFVFNKILPFKKKKENLKFKKIMVRKIPYRLLANNKHNHLITQLEYIDLSHPNLR